MNIVTWLWRVLDRAVAPWGEIGRDVLLERSLLDQLPEAETGVVVNLRHAHPDEIDTIVCMYASDPWLYLGDATPTPDGHKKALALYRQRLHRGELCFLALSGDTIAHVNWSCFTLGEVLPDYPIRLRAGEVFTTDAITQPPFRGKNLHAHVLREMLVLSRERGCTHAYTLSRVDRKNSLKGLARLGWRECGRMLYFLPWGGTKTRFLWRQGNLDPLFRHE